MEKEVEYVFREMKPYNLTTYVLCDTSKQYTNSC